MTVRPLLVVVFLSALFPCLTGPVNAGVAALPTEGNFTNPVIHADYSDPDVVRVGEDYWMTSSSFNHVPGLPLLHSRDLVNWSLAGHALQRLVPEEGFAVPRHGGGVWAPSIRHHDGLYRIYYPDPDHGIYLVTATDPSGPWSKPILVREGKGLIDPCPFWDADGKTYLIHAWAKSRTGFNNMLTLLRLDGSGTKVVEDCGVVIDGNSIPGWRTLEGPKLYRIGGWYYVFAPAGGVPAGWQAVFRSRSIRGPYEHRIVMDQGGSAVNGPHQGALVDTPGGEWWFLHFQDKGAYGRIVHLQPVSWREGWPVIGSDPGGTGKGEPVSIHGRPFLPRQSEAKARDDGGFAPPRLGLEWQWEANPTAGWFSLKARPGCLRLKALPRSIPNLWSAPSLLLQKFPAERFSAETVLDPASLKPGARAGLVVFGSDYASLTVGRTATGFRVRLMTCIGARDGAPEREVTSAAVDPGMIRLCVQVSPGGVCRFAYGTAEKGLLPIGNDFTAKPGRWVGAKVGLFSESGGDGAGGFADFGSFGVKVDLAAGTPGASRQ